MVGVVQREGESVSVVVVVSWCYTASAAAEQQGSKGRERANEVGGSQAVYNDQLTVCSGGREGSCLGVV